eukprot:137275_1
MAYIVEFYNLVLPMGCSLAILIIIALLYDLIKSFSKNKISKQMKISSSLLFIFCIVYNFASIAGRIIIPKHICWLRIILHLVCYYVIRGTLYYFFIIRIEESFLGTKLQFSSTLMKSLRLFDIIFHLLMILGQISVAKYWIFYTENQICLPSDDVKTLQYTLLGSQILMDIMLGGICIGLFINRLCKLYSALKILENTKVQMPVNILLNSVKKQSKLVVISYATTLIIVYLGTLSPYLSAFIFIDNIIS